MILSTCHFQFVPFHHLYTALPYALGIAHPRTNGKKKTRILLDQPVLMCDLTTGGLEVGLGSVDDTLGGLRGKADDDRLGEDAGDDG